MGSKNTVHHVDQKVNETRLSIKHPSLRYINEFLRTDAAIDLRTKGLFRKGKPGKEISETLAGYNAIRKEFKNRLKDRDIKMFSVGDGKRPRTAAYTAFMTEWECHSIDPILEKPREYEQKINQLNCHSEKIQNLSFEADTAVIAMVHTHVSIEETIKSIDANKYFIVAIPCCQPLTLKEQGIEPSKVYWDWGIFSPERKIKIYRGELK